MKSRILIVFVGVIGLWTALTLRAAFLQILPSAKLKALHEKQFQTIITLQSRRGAIVDRNGRELALSTTAYSLYADPKIIDQRKATARRLAKELNQSYESIWSKIKSPEKRFVWLSRQMEKEQVERIKSWGVKGLAFVEEFKRVYPNESLLAQTLGFIGREGQGLEGLELAYDHQLIGDKKKVQVRRDARGRPLIADGMMFAENPDGVEIRLTIDGEIQHAIERELVDAVAEFDADQAFGVVLDAKTSAILALATAPTFDPNHPMSATAHNRKNKIITDTFEPGSTMKTFAAAAALKEGVAQPNSRYSTENGIFKVGDRIIREAELDHKWQSLSVSEILAYSSNIGTTKIAFQLGAEKLRAALNDFGFGQKSGIELPGEARGALQPLPWNQHLLSNVSFGHGVSATPLQMANAYAAIANGGKLNTPYLVSSIRDPETGKVTETNPKMIRRVLSEDVASSLRLMLLGVTNNGTGVNAKVDGFMVAGKTGTAQKVNPNGRGYLNKAYVSSFAGFIPANDPKFVIFIAVDHPKKNAYYGSSVAAPIFSRIASYAVRKEGLAPLLLTEKNLVPTPGFAFKETAGTKNKNTLKRVGPKIERKTASIGNNGGAVALPDRVQANTAAELLLTKDKPILTSMPEIKSLSLRQALQKLRGAEAQIKVIGQGSVVQTIPEAGQPLDKDSPMQLILSQ
jgi:cell division protein FtsI (penicillin-binding protein 3)